MTIERRAFLDRLFVGGGVASVVALASMRVEASGITPAAITPVYYNVLDYGAVGNGTTDDTNAIQDAVDAAAAAGGGTVILPANTYYVATTVIISTNGISIVGVNTAATIIKAPNTGSAATLKFTGCDSGAVKNLTISSSARSTGISILFDNNCTCTTVEDVNLTSQYIGVQINGGVIHRVNRGNWLMSAGGTGLYVGGPVGAGEQTIAELHVSRITLAASSSTHPAIGFQLRNLSGAFIDSCDVIHCIVGLSITPSSGTRVEYCFFSNCCWDSSDDRNIIIDASLANRYVHGMFFSNCWSATATYDCCVVTGSNVNGCSFVAHKFFNSTSGNGLWVSAAKNVYVDNCQASGIAVGNAYCFLGNASDFAVRNSFAGVVGSTGSATFPANSIGMRVVAGCNNYIITGNVFRGNATNVLDQGGPNKVVTANLIT
jgi:hypothetical protein